MDQIGAFLPSIEKGYLPAYLFLVRLDLYQPHTGPKAPWEL